jgi:hypothetical protein
LPLHLLPERPPGEYQVSTALVIALSPTMLELRKHSNGINLHNRDGGI